MYGTVTLPDYCAAEVHFASGSLDRKNRSGSLRIINMYGTITLLAGHRVDTRAWHSSTTLHATLSSSFLQLSVIHLSCRCVPDTALVIRSMPVPLLVCRKVSCLCLDEVALLALRNAALSLEH